MRPLFVWKNNVALYTPGLSPAVLIVTTTFREPPGVTVPWSGFSEIHGTSWNAGTPLSTRYAWCAFWLIIQRLPASSISMPAPLKPGFGWASVVITWHVSGFSS